VIELHNFRHGHQVKDHFLSEKLNVIHDIKAKSVTSQDEIANCLGLAPSSLSRIMLNKNKIIEGEMKCGKH
jgi:hypothetical protein